MLRITAPITIALLYASLFLSSVGFPQDTIETLPLADLTMASAEMNVSQYKNLMVLIFQFSSKKPQEIFFFSCENVPVSIKFIHLCWGISFDFYLEVL